MGNKNLSKCKFMNGDDVKNRDEMKQPTLHTFDLFGTLAKSPLPRPCMKAETLFEQKLQETKTCCGGFSDSFLPLNAISK